MDRDPASTDDLPINRHDPYAALRSPNFRWFASGNFLSIFGLHMQSTAVGWEIFQRTNSALALAMVGLVQVAPVLVLAMFAGHVADRFNRRYIIMAALSAIALSSIGLGLVSIFEGPIFLTYACLFVAGVARAFQQPAKSSLLPQLVPRSIFTNAITWNSTIFQLAAVTGPATGGVLIWLMEPAIVYWCDAVAAMSFFFFLSQIRYQSHKPLREPLTLRSLSAGAEFVWKNKVILGASGLDMFAVLLGGAVYLLPIYAEKDMLDVGAKGLGWMQASPAVGALCMSFLLAHRRPMERAGRALLGSVVAFGIVTIAFGLSRSFPLSMLMLFLIGATDTVSVVVRHSLVQLLTPDEMRGRVSAINGMFISVSNELGRFRSGVVAWMFTGMFSMAGGATISVVSGGIGTLLVVAAAAWWLPELRRYGRLPTTEPEMAPPADILEPGLDQTEPPEVLPPISETDGRREKGDLVGQK